MQKISDFLNIPYSEAYFNYPNVVNNFFSNIQHPQLKKHFLITHKSLQQPISPQKINEWQHHLDDKNIKYLINATWTSTKSLATKLNYKEHHNYLPEKLFCLKSILKIKWALVSSYIYFNYLPYFIKKQIKIKKYPHRINTISAYDKFLRKGYL